MADNLLESQGNVSVIDVGNNVVVCNPNKIRKGQEDVDRMVPSEDLVMYAKLTANILPRSYTIRSGKGTTENITIAVSREGELNFLKPQGKTKLDTDWTETFTNPDVNKKVITDNSVNIENPIDFQGFGITSIAIKVNTSYIPQVSISFTDIRGKTLFEQAEGNTPYTAFFHLPYPTFFLTIKRML